MSIDDRQEICFIGAGHVGATASAIIAHKNPNIFVHVVDQDETRIDAWNSNNLPIKEPRLLSIIQSVRDASDTQHLLNLRFSTSVRYAVKRANIIFITVDTPLNTTGYGAGQVLDPKHIYAAVDTIAEHATSHKIIIVKSTVPCGTSSLLSMRTVLLGRPGLKFDVLYNPEFLAEGSAVTNLLNPDRILIGSNQKEWSLRAAASLRQIYSWIPDDRVVLMDLQSAELAKLAANALLAQRISSINAISAICEKKGADVEKVALACGLDTRIGPQMLKASLGFGGSCLKKDTSTLAFLADELGLDQISTYWSSINKINEFQKARFAERVTKELNDTSASKKIAVLGCAFKKNTSDVRESPGLTVMVALLKEQYHLAIYDPEVSPTSLLNALADLVGENCECWRAQVVVYGSAYDACSNASAAVIATDWDEFNNTDAISEPEISSDVTQLLEPIVRVDWTRIETLMQHPKLIFDGRNFMNDEKLTNLGFKVHQIGKGLP